MNGSNGKLTLEDREKAEDIERRELRLAHMELENERLSRSLGLKDRPVRRFFHDEKALVIQVALGMITGALVMGITAFVLTSL